MAMLFSNRAKPEEVFTPRRPIVNPDMYVSRARLEGALKRALGQTKHIIVTGESGSGKTWLYKSVFADLGVHHDTVNLATASFRGNLDAAFKEKVDRLEQETPVEHTTGGAAKVTPYGVGVEKTGSIKSAIGQKSSFEQLLAGIRKRAGKKTAVLVYENLEQIVGNVALLKAASDTIILLDDDDISHYNVKLCIVGVPTDLRAMLMRASDNVTTLANRTLEIPEVARLTDEEAHILMRRGFETRLKCKFSVNPEQFYADACWKTDRIAQHIHEYCLCVAQFAEENDYTIDDKTVSAAEKDWLSQSLGADYAAVETRMNARDTKAGRRNQILYSLGACDEEDFKSTDIEKIVRAEFPESTEEVTLNIAGNMSELTSGNKPILRRTPKGDAFRFISPKYRMCLRTMLRKTVDERVEKIPQTEL